MGEIFDPWIAWNIVDALYVGEETQPVNSPSNDRAFCNHVTVSLLDHGR